MPRVNLGPKDKYGALRVLLYGYIGAAHLEDAAAKAGISRSTLSRRLADPGNLKLSELLEFGRKHHIPIEDVRNAIRY